MRTFEIVSHALFTCYIPCCGGRTCMHHAWAVTNLHCVQSNTHAIMISIYSINGLHYSLTLWYWYSQGTQTWRCVEMTSGPCPFHSLNKVQYNVQGGQPQPPLIWLTNQIRFLDLSMDTVNAAHWCPIA